MKSDLNTPTITAQALGELTVPEQRLLKMTHTRPQANEALAAELEEIRAVGHLLQRALKSESPALSLSTAQRENILVRITASTPVERQAATEGMSLERVLQERSAFDRKPGRIASYLTFGAAAAVIALLAILRPKPTTSTASAVRPSDQGEEIQTSKFKVIPPKAEAPKLAENLRSDTDHKKLGPPPTPKLLAPPDRETTPGATAQKGNSALPTPEPKPATPGPLPQTVKIPESADPASNARTYASPPPTNPKK